MKIVGATGLGGLWALEWAWHIRVTRYPRIFEVCGWFGSVIVGVAKFYCIDIGIDENITFQLKFVF